MSIPQVLGIEDSGQRVTIDVGDKIFVKLPGIEGPGYGWTLLPGDRTIIDTTNGEMFVAKGLGSTRLVFAYHHPFENRAPIKTMTFDIQVVRSRWKTILGIGAVVAVAGGVTYAATRKKRKQ